MRNRILSLAALAAVTLASLTAFAVKPEPPTEATSDVYIPLPPGAKAAAASNNALATDLYAQLRTRAGNLFFSPLSISTALVMTWEGAGGKTNEEMTKTLHLGEPEDARAGFAALYRRLQPAKTPAGFELSMANRLWGLQGYPYQPDFITRVEKNYGAGFEPVDFVQSAQASATINAWVEKNTHGKITNLIPASALNDLTRLVLTNAIYFKADWDKAFKEAATTEGDFHLTAEKTIPARLMHQTGRFAYGETTLGGESVQLVEMNYLAPTTVSMIVLLPKLGSLEAMEKNLDAATLDKAFAAMPSRQVILTLPKFKMSESIALNDTLKELGMKLAFDVHKADFSGMTAKEGLHISAVLHKAYVDVNEKGTEAAAATGVIMATRSAVMAPQKPVEFTADHPFIFVIRDKLTGALIFMGRVSSPGK